MAFDPHANLAYATVTTAPSPADSGLTLEISNADAAQFPDPATAGAYNCTAWAAQEIPIKSNSEIVRVTAKAAAPAPRAATHTQLTITRTQESSLARSIVVGDQLAITITKKVIDDIENNKADKIASGVEDNIVTIDASENIKDSGLSVIDDDTMATASATNVPTSESVKNFVGAGWTPASETWEYVSTDDPTGVFRVNADVTTKYSVSMRIKMTNGGNTIYGIITAISAYGAVNAGYTHITFLHEIDPSDNLALYLMANSAITANYYSTQKAPFGFPLDPRKWSVIVKDTGNRTQASPTQNQWYNLQSVSLSIPIGAWKVNYKVQLSGFKSNATLLELSTTLSTANNSESDTEFTGYAITELAANGLCRPDNAIFIEKYLLLTSKTPYYLNTRTSTASANQLENRGGNTPTIIRAICAYL